MLEETVVGSFLIFSQRPSGHSGSLGPPVTIGTVISGLVKGELKSKTPFSFLYTEGLW